MAIKVGKPDYYVVLKKRRRTVAGYLKDREVKSRKDLEVIVQDLEKEHLISDIFLAEANKYLAQVLASNPSKKPEDEQKKEVPTPEKESTVEKLDTPVKGVEDATKEPAQKPKKRTRRSTKKTESRSAKKSEERKGAAEE